MSRPVRKYPEQTHIWGSGGGRAGVKQLTGRHEPLEDTQGA
jgi:hypothetical protein